MVSLAEKCFRSIRPSGARNCRKRYTLGDSYRIKKYIFVQSTCISALSADEVLVCLALELDGCVAVGAVNIFPLRFRLSSSISSNTLLRA
jgi:hypothetical protein